MKKTVAAVLGVFLIPLLAGPTIAAGSPVKVDHNLTQVGKTESSVTFDYSLHVTNTGDQALRGVTLSLVPRPPYTRDRVTVNVGSLNPRQGVDRPLRVVTRMQVNPDRVSQLPLFWEGSCLGIDGKEMVFPIVSRPGGAK